MRYCSHGPADSIACLILKGAGAVPKRDKPDNKEGSAGQYKEYNERERCGRPWGSRQERDPFSAMAF